MEKLIKYILFLAIIMVTAQVKGQRSDFVSSSDQEYAYAFSEATRHYIFGNYVQAISLYKECVRLKPKSSTAYFQLSKIYLNAGNVALARENAKRASAYSKSNKWIIQHLGDIYQMEEKYDSAVSVYNELLVMDSLDVDLIFNIASLYEKADKNDRALDELKRIDNQIGPSKEVSMMRYRLFEKKNLPDSALKQLKTASLLSGDDFTVTGMIAEFYRQRSEPDSAMKYYREIFPRYKDESIVIFSFADFLLEYGKVDSAKALIISLMNDASIDNMVKTGYFYNVLSDEKKVLRAVPVLDSVAEAFIRQSPKDIRSLSIYADIQLRLRHFRKAANTLKKVVILDVMNYSALEQLIYTLNILGSTDSVLLYSQTAIEQFNERPLPYLFNGSANFQKGNYERSIDLLNKGLSLTQDNALKVEFYSLLAEGYQNIGKYAESENAFNAALIIDPNNIAIKNNYAYYLSLREKNLNSAEQMSLETIIAEPENPTYLDTYAWILFKAGKTRKAWKYIDKALQYGGKGNSEILKHGGEILKALKQYENALKLLKEALSVATAGEIPEIQKQISEIERLNKK